MAEKIFGRWVERDPADAAQNALKLPDSNLRNRAFELIGAQWAESDPRAAVGWEYTHEKEYFKSGYHGGALETWMLNEPEQAMKWLQEIPDDGKKSALLSQAGSYAAEQPDPTVWRRVALMLPEGGDRDRALARCVQQLADEHPETVLAWAREETDDHLKRVMLSGVTAGLQGDALREALQEIQRLNAQGNGQVSLDGWQLPVRT